MCPGGSLGAKTSSGDTVLPDCNSDFELATKFRDFFSNKVKAIRESIPTSSISHEQSSLAGGIVPLNHFAPATLDELRSIISKYSIKCSPEDPLPATVMKKNLELLLPYWLDIVNLLLGTGTIDGLKMRLSSHFLKKLALTITC